MKAPAQTAGVIAPQRYKPALPTGTFYVIEGRPGWRFPSIDDACQEAAELVARLRLSGRVFVREAGSDSTVAMVSRELDGGIVVVRFEPAR